MGNEKESNKDYISPFLILSFLDIIIIIIIINCLFGVEMQVRL